MDVFEKLVLNLQTISSIGKGDKLTTSAEFLLVENASLMQPIWRKLSNENREKCARKIRSVIDLAIYISDLLLDSNGLKNSPENVIYKKISLLSGYLNKAKTGLENLIETYNDNNFASDIIPIMDLIVHQVSKIDRVLSSIPHKLIFSHLGPGLLT